MSVLERIAFNCADHIVVLTEGMRSELERIGCRRPISVIPLWTAEIPESPIVKQAFPILMYSGNFGKKQNLEQLLPLIKRLSVEKPSVRVLMQGDGSEREKIETLFSDAGITNTTFLPLAPANQFAASLQAAAIHLVPQAQKVGNYALPSKIFSIMSAGRPFICIAENDSPLDRLAKLSGAGICITPGDEARLFEATVGLLEDTDELELRGQKGRAFVRSFMSKEVIMKQYYLALFEAGEKKRWLARMVDELK
jgi:colanic acid biosynthesis glycosyl transferase WcaI